MTRMTGRANQRMDKKQVLAAACPTFVGDARDSQRGNATSESWKTSQLGYMPLAGQLSDVGLICTRNQGEKVQMLRVLDLVDMYVSDVRILNRKKVAEGRLVGRQL